MVPRGDWGMQYMRRFYLEITHLWESDVDGLIVTGAEPQAPTLEEEPYWGSLTQVIDWAQENTTSAIWSCLAVHATALHLDGIGRHQLNEKCSGVFRQIRMDDHLLTKGVGPQIWVPHSRWNEVKEEALVSGGYRIVTKSRDAGVDTFTKQQGKSLFVFFQGHPEYDVHSLLGEYRRDVGRFLRGEVERYPGMPHGYFDEESSNMLLAFQEQALSDRRIELLSKFPVDHVAARLKNTWHIEAKRIYRNWISYLSF
jgi:homoserine O-succinyltransferase/O-acetyltransferase